MRNIPKVGFEGLEDQNIEVQNDLVSPKDLLVYLAASVICTITAVLIASSTGRQTLYWGLGASVVSFVLSCFLIALKRDVRIIDEMELVDADEESVERPRNSSV